MLQKVTVRLVGLTYRYLPDPWVIALGFTLIISIMACLWGGQSFWQILLFWGDGFWDLLSFTMQVLLTLVTGHALAGAPVIRRFLVRLARIPRSPGQAIIMTTMFSALACWVNWAFGLVFAALLARQVSREVQGVHYPLLVASAYSGFLVFHGGLSGPVPMALATPGNFSQSLIGIIPFSETIFSAFNLVIVVFLLLTLPMLNRLMYPGKEAVFSIQKDTDVEDVPIENIPRKISTGEQLSYYPILSKTVGLFGLSYLLAKGLFGHIYLDSNTLNFLFLFIGIFLHPNLKSYQLALFAGAKGAVNISLLYPFYAGIMGVMAHSGLPLLISNWAIRFATQTTFPLLTFLSAGLLHLFIPSGGGQWVVQGPIILHGAQELGVSSAKAAMAVAWGNAWTNMLQPFWALPALAIAKLEVKDIMGYCIIDLIYSGIFIGLFLTIF